MTSWWSGSKEGGEEESTVPLSPSRRPPTDLRAKLLTHGPQETFQIQTIAAGIFGLSCSQSSREIVHVHVSICDGGTSSLVTRQLVLMKSPWSESRSRTQVGQDTESLSSMQVACEKTVSAMHHVLQRTIQCAKGTCPRALPSHGEIVPSRG